MNRIWLILRPLYKTIRELEVWDIMRINGILRSLDSFKLQDYQCGKYWMESIVDGMHNLNNYSTHKPSSILIQAMNFKVRGHSYNIINCIYIYIIYIYISENIHY